jgi:tetratricopeptide (TPR) repeat protein/GGDEF domain-containing protein
MLIIKKTLFFFYNLLIFSLFSVSFSTLADNNLNSQEKLIAEVEYLFEQSGYTLNHNKVIKLGNKIINQRINYPSEIIAKTYLLLANVAINKGELETALQFTNDGLATANQNQAIILPLQINLAQIFSAKKQYKKLLTTVQQAINTPKNKKNTTCFLIALSYRSVAFAMLGQHSKALTDLQQVESVIQQNAAFSEHISLLTILANAYYYLGDYRTALTVQLKILKLRFNLDKLNNIDQTYFHLANAYYRLNRLNDAYTAFWEAKKYAIKKNAPIYIGYASQGLSRILLRQKQYVLAKAEALQAKALFYQYNLATPHLESIIILTQIYHAIKQEDQRLILLLEAEKLATRIELTPDYIILYQYLADMYLIKQDLKKAYLWQNKYSESLLENILFTKKLAQFNRYPTNSKVIKYNKNKDILASTKARELAIKLAEQSELTSSYSGKFHNQQLSILILTVVTFLLLIFIIIVWIKQRSKRLQTEYEALEKPGYILANSRQTKQLYQTSFDMSRQYNYALTLGYVSITNWQELTFQFNKKTVSEVSRGIASLINEQLNDFESAGLINNGEYLLLFPHQNKENVTKTMEKLVSALNLRFFANLGEFSITIAYSIESPKFQDIDPYIFLSQLSDSIKVA